MSNLYSGISNGFMQEAYYDRQGAALPGALAFASDICLIDSFAVGEVGPDGLEAGVAVTASPLSGGHYSGINAEAASLPAEGAAAADIIGVTVRSAGMSSNSAGRACWFAPGMCNVARLGRSGARLWVQLTDEADPEPGGIAHVGVGGENAGRFASEPGDGFVEAPQMIFRSRAQNGLALLELM